MWMAKAKVEDDLHDSLSDKPVDAKENQDQKDNHDAYVTDVRGLKEKERPEEEVGEDLKYDKPPW
jgi:hypothetical protein